MTSQLIDTKTMKAVLYKAPHELGFEEIPYPKPGPGEVTVKVAYSGICGTDYHILEGDFISPYPLVGGHEFSGIIHEIGDGVEGWTLGERVAADPSVYCGECYHCRNNQFNHCEDWNAIGVTLNGAFAEYVKVPAKNLYRLPDHVTFEQGALIEPLSCVAFGLNRIAPKFGEKAVIFGAGPMGLMLLQSIKVSGVSEVIMVDIDEEKLAFAKRLGATSVYKNDQMLDEYIGGPNYPHGFDIVVDATGIPKVIEGMFRFAGPRARILQFGVAPSNSKISINPFDIYHKDWQYLGSMALMFNFYQALHMIEQGRIDMDSLVTQKISLEDFPKYMSSKKPASDCKVLVHFNI
jgi:2-desacetyl-2-hydroxyethyl bacteriochlorophyllide A dehydrogenase